MAMGVSQDDDEDTPMSDINVTPLVDVMLVLLIIFLIAVPFVLQTVPVSLPQVRYEPTTTKPENVNLSVRDQQDRIARRALAQEKLAGGKFDEIAVNDEGFEILFGQRAEGLMPAKQLKIGSDIADDPTLLWHASPGSRGYPSRRARRHFRPVSADRPRSRRPSSAARRPSSLGLSSRALR